MTSTSTDYEQKNYWPWIDAANRHFSPEKLEQLIQYPEHSDIIMMFLPFKDVWTPSARTWRDVTSNPDLQPFVTQNTQLIGTACFWAGTMKDIQVDIGANTRTAPAFVALVGDVPSAQPGELPVGMSITIFLQGVRHQLPPEQEENTDMTDTEAQETDAEDTTEGEMEEEGQRKRKKRKKKKGPTAAERKKAEKEKKEALKRLNSAPSVYRSWAEWLKANSDLESEQLQTNLLKPAQRGLSKLSKQQQSSTETIKVTGETLRKWRQRCEMYSGRDINIDRAQAMFDNVAGIYTEGELGDLCPSEVFTVSRFVELCRIYGADPSYCDRANYPVIGREGRSFNLPIPDRDRESGKYHFYRMSHEDLRDGQHGRTIWNQFFPHIPVPDISQHPGVIEYNIQHNLPPGTVNDACRRAFLQFEKTNIFTADEELARSLPARYAAKYEECKYQGSDGKMHLDLAMWRQERRIIQLDALNKMHSYWQRSNKLPRADIAIMEWGDEYLSKHNGIMFWELQKTSKNLSWFGNKIDCFNTSTDYVFAINNLQKQMMMVYPSTLGVNLTRELHLNFLIHGPPGLGKSYLYKKLYAMCIKHTLNMLSGSSQQYDTDGSNTLNNSVEINEEVEGSKLGLKQSGSGKPGNGASDRESATKGRMTSGKTSRARLTKDKDTGEYKTKVFETMCNIVTWCAMNDCAFWYVPEGILNRFIIMSFTDRYTDEYREVRKFDTEETVQETEFIQRIYERFRYVQYLFARAARVLNSGIAEKVDLAVPDQLIRKIMDCIKHRGEHDLLKRMDTRFIQKYQFMTEIFCIWEAVSIVFESPVSDERGKQFTDESILKIEPYTVATQEHAVFAFSLLSEVIIPEVERQVISCLRDSYMRLSDDPVTEAKQPNTEAKQPVFNIGSRSDSNSSENAITPVFTLGSSTNNARDSAVRTRAQRTSNSSSSSENGNKTAFQSYPPQEPDYSRNPIEKDGVAKLADKGFYVERNYDDGTIFRSQLDRQLSVANAIHARLGNISISVDDVRMVLACLEKRMVAVPGSCVTEAKTDANHHQQPNNKKKRKRTTNEKGEVLRPALVWGDKSIKIASSVLDGHSDATPDDRMLTYLEQCIDPRQVMPEYDTILGIMDEKHTTRFRAHKFQHEENVEASIVPQPRYVCPASAHTLLSMITRPGERPPDTSGVFHSEPVMRVDANLCDSRVEERLLRLGLSYKDFKDKPHPKRAEFNRQVDAVSDTEFVYPNKYLEMDEVTGILRDLLSTTQPPTNEKLRATLKELPPISARIDGVIKSILSDPDMPLNLARSKLATVVSVKSRARQISKILKHADSMHH